MSRKQLVTLVVAGTIVVIGIIFGVLTRKSGVLIPESKEEKKEEEIALPITGEEIPVFTPQLPQDTKPTIPQISAPAAPGRDEKVGIFEMKVSAAGFEPNSITVSKDDIVQIRLTAEGGDYDFSMPYNGLYTKVSNGETQQISFGVNTAGTYGFTCRDFCPPGKIISGSIIVLPD